MDDVMRNSRRMAMVYTALDECKLSLEEVRSKPEHDPNNADWIGGVGVIQQRRANAERVVYEKFYKKITEIATAPETNGLEETWVGFKLINTSDDAFGNEMETFKCGSCGRTITIASGGDIACCPCEFENEGMED